MADDEDSPARSVLKKYHPRYLMVFIVFVEFFVVVGPLYNYGILLVSFQEEFQSSAALTGWAGSLACAVFGCSGLISAFFIHRFGPRKITLAGAVVFAAGLAATSFVPALIYTFLTVGLMVGLGAGFVFQAGMTLILDWFPGKSCSSATSLTLLGTSFSVFALAPLLNTLISAYGWRNALRIFSGGSLIITLAHGWFIVKPALVQPQDVDTSGYEMVKTNEVDKNDDGQPQNSGQLRKNTETLGQRGTKLCRQVDAWLWIFAGILLYLGWTFSTVNLASFMEWDLGFTSGQVSTTFVLLALGEIVGKIVLSAFSSRFPFRKLYVQAVSSFLGAGVAGLMIVLQTVPLIYTVAAFMGLVRAASFALPYAAAQELFGDYGSDIVTMLGTMPYGIGVLIGAPISGGLYDLTGDYGLSLLVTVAIFTCSAGLLLLIPIGQRLRSRESGQRKREPTVV